MFKKNEFTIFLSIFSIKFKKKRILNSNLAFFYAKKYFFKINYVFLYNLI